LAFLDVVKGAVLGEGGSGGVGEKPGDRIHTADHECGGTVRGRAAESEGPSALGRLTFHEGGDGKRKVAQITATAAIKIVVAEHGAAMPLRDGDQHSVALPHLPGRQSMWGDLDDLAVENKLSFAVGRAGFAYDAHRGGREGSANFLLRFARPG
jgi:hypothetical protein